MNQDYTVHYEVTGDGVVVDVTASDQVSLVDTVLVDNKTYKNLFIAQSVAMNAINRYHKKLKEKQKNGL